MIYDLSDVPVRITAIENHLRKLFPTCECSTEDVTEYSTNNPRASIDKRVYLFEGFIPRDLQIFSILIECYTATTEIYVITCYRDVAEILNSEYPDAIISLCDNDTMTKAKQ